MKTAKLMVWIISFLIVMSTFVSFSYATQNDDLQDNMSISTSELSNSQAENNNKDIAERNNFDIASLLSLLGIGLLKFIDDKLKIKFKDRFNTYRNYLIVMTIIFGLLEASIVFCYITNMGAVSFGNLKNIFLGLIPVVFCVLTLITAKNESLPLILSQDQLEKRINEFTSSGMSPLGMIVGDMDFFGQVYAKTESKKKAHRNDITTNSQIQALIENKIDSIRIVCKIPATKEAKRRIGYLKREFEDRFHIRFFNEEKFPIPQMRGRIMYKHGEEVVVITRKIRKPSQYEYSEYAVSSLPGGLFADLWQTVWNCCEENDELINQCIQAYITCIGKQKESVQ